MLASYLLSRTLIPTLAKFWLKKKDESDGSSGRQLSAAASARLRARLRAPARPLSRACSELALDGGTRFAADFSGCHGRYGAARVSARAAAGAGPGFLSQRRCRPDETAHPRARPALRIEETAALAIRSRTTIRSIIPREGAHQHRRQHSACPTAASTWPTAPRRPSARATPTSSSIWPRSTPRCEDYQRRLRAKLAATSPSTQFQFLPADIVSQILNFGLPSPLDIQISGPRRQGQSGIHQ